MRLDLLAKDFQRNILSDECTISLIIDDSSIIKTEGSLLSIVRSTHFTPKPFFNLSVS